MAALVPVNVILVSPLVLYPVSHRSAHFTMAVSALVAFSVTLTGLVSVSPVLTTVPSVPPAVGLPV